MSQAFLLYLKGLYWNNSSSVAQVLCWMRSDLHGSHDTVSHHILWESLCVCVCLSAEVRERAGCFERPPERMAARFSFLVLPVSAGSLHTHHLPGAQVPLHHRAGPEPVHRDRGTRPSSSSHSVTCFGNTYFKVSLLHALTIIISDRPILIFYNRHRLFVRLCTR